MNFSPTFAPRAFREVFMGCGEVFGTGLSSGFDDHGYDAALAIADQATATFNALLPDIEADFRSGERDMDA